eukprot:UN03836
MEYATAQMWGIRDGMLEGNFDGSIVGITVGMLVGYQSLEQRLDFLNNKFSCQYWEFSLLKND